MELFKTLSEVLGEGCTLSLTIAHKDGQMTVSLLPGNDLVKDGAKNKIIPLTVTGSPEELDAELPAIIAKPIETTSGLLTNMAQYEKEVEEAKAKSKMEEERKAAEAKKAKDHAAWLALGETNLKECKFRDALKCADEAEKNAQTEQAKMAVSQFRTRVNDASGVGSVFGACEDRSDGKNVKINVKPSKPASKDSDSDDEGDE